MSLFIMHLILTLVWFLLIGDQSMVSLASGFLIGFAVLWIAKPMFDTQTTYFGRLFRVVHLIAFFLYELILSSIQVAWDVLTPTHLSQPAIIEMPLDVTSDLEIFLVANLISLTPGTLCLDVDRRRNRLIIHAMFAPNPEQLVRELKNGMEMRVKRVFES
jgi:multicomponent Na+:H+ antiporter subunit E